MTSKINEDNSGLQLEHNCEKKNTWEQVPGNPIHWVIYRIHTGPSQLPIYGITVKGLHPGVISKVGLIVY